MPSKTSKARPPLPCPWKEEPSCSEAGIATLARELASHLVPGDRVVLEGPMGSGKSTLARRLLLAMGAGKIPEGSPSFAIAHEYRLEGGGEAVHIDFYRLGTESEIEEAGLPSYFWERDAIIITEWLSLWPEFERPVLAQCLRSIWEVRLAFVEGQPLDRSVKIFRRPSAGRQQRSVRPPSQGAKRYSRVRRSQ